MKWTPSDERWMRRALDLAQRGRFSTWPNPMVGCVVVENDALLSEGWHRAYGEAHAEVNALSALDEHVDLSQATAYVTLEPCSHVGKTPPCADLIVRRGLKRVVVATTDPNPLVGGKGLDRLRNSGIHVEVGCLESEASRVNRRFVHAMTQQRPWITLKWAQSSDGFLDSEADAAPQRGGVALTGNAAKRHTHGLRATHDGIMVGMNTWLVDVPSLTTRDVPGPSPKRFILTRGDTPCPEDFPAKADDSPATVLVHPAHAIGNAALESWEKWGMELVAMNAPALTSEWWVEFRQATGVSACLVEGGAEIAQATLNGKTWDELHVLEAPLTLNQGLRAPSIDHSTALETTPIGSDVLYVWRQDMNHANRTLLA